MHMHGDRTGICVCTDIAISAYYFCILKILSFIGFTANILISVGPVTVKSFNAGLSLRLRLIVSDS